MGRTLPSTSAAPDETVLDALALDRPTTRSASQRSVLPNLAAGDSIYIDGTSYRVREVRSIGDG